MEQLLQDLRFGVRMLHRNPGFTFVAVLTLAIGIGANTVVFSLGSALLLHPLPFRDSNRLVWIDNPEPGGEGIPGLIGQANFRDWQSLNQSFEALGAYLPSFTERSAFALTGAGEPLQLRGAYVSGNLLGLLGIQPALGRGFSEEERQRNGPKAVLLTDGFWRRRYGGDPSLVGRSMTISGASWTVVGILPPAFDYGFSSMFAPGCDKADFLLPFKPHPGYDNFGNFMVVVGKPKPGVSIGRAQSEFDLLNRQLRSAYPGRGKFGARLTALREHVSGSHRRPFNLLACAVAAVLLIACVNLSGLVLARGANRCHELALRTALGAERWRLVRQMLTESLLLSAAGGALGLPLAYVATAVIARTYSFHLPLLETARIDFLALLVTALGTLCAGLLFGTVPAIVLSGAEVGSKLKEAARVSGSGPRGRWVQEVVVITQVALTCVLLVGSGLLIHSLIRLLAVDPGFRPENSLSVRIQTYRRAESEQAQAAYYHDLLGRVREIPGVEAATLPDKLPFGLNDQLRARRNGEPSRPGEVPTIFAQMVDPSFFKTLGIRLYEGREFVKEDFPFDWKVAGTQIAVVNRKLAAKFWPGQSALDQTILLESFPNDSAKCRIVGVVGDVRETGLDREAGPSIYMVGGGGSDLVIRTRAPLASMIPLVRSALRQFDPDMALSDFRPLMRIIQDAVAPRQLICSLLAGFSVIALALAAMGIYGVMANSVCRRAKEFGIRIALGSSRRALLVLVLRQGLRLALVGCVIGLVGSVALMRAIGSMLFGVAPTDPATMIASGMLALGVMLVACWGPAWRAGTTDPMSALRGE